MMKMIQLNRAKQVPKLKLEFGVVVVITILLTSQFLQTVSGYPHDEIDDEEDDYLLTKIDCNTGDKYDYVMTTQNSLFDDKNANLQVKGKIELKCKNKQQWLNESTGVLKNGQLFEVTIKTVRPEPIDTQTKMANGKAVNGKLQMASLFQNLENLPDSKRNQPNIRVASVNTFFSQLAHKVELFFRDIFQRLMSFFENYMKKKNRTGPNSREAEHNFDWRCSKDDSAKVNGRRHKRSKTFRSINFDPIQSNIDEMYKRPFTFLQLEDGSVKNIRLSSLDTDPSVINYKKFIAQSFATQLDQRKKLVVENSMLGKHISHYRMDYDEPNRTEVTPHDYMKQNLPSRRAKRSSDVHLVSVIRSVYRDDIINNNNNNKKSNHYRNNNEEKRLGLSDIDFSVHQVQLIEDNILVASGGYFSSILPMKKAHINQEHSHSHHHHQHNPSKRDTTNQSDEFDKLMKTFLSLNMEYSMVRITKSRWKRSTNDDSNKDNKFLKKYKFYMDKIFDENQQMLRKQIFESNSRFKRGTSERSNQNNSNVVCRTVEKSFKNRFIENDESNEIGDKFEGEVENEPNKIQECYEYKEFGSSLLKAYFNKTVLSEVGSRRGKSLDNFETRYKVAAQMLGQDMVLGRIEITKNNDLSKLTLNMFGSEYVDLNLCDIRDRDFFHANQIPLFTENIWFMTDVSVKIMYRLKFKIDVPGAVCKNQNSDNSNNDSNSVILSRLMSDKFELNQNTQLEFGGSFDASFLIFKGIMTLDGNFDMDSKLDFSTDSCLSARSIVKPMNVSVKFNYRFFHPACDEWIEDGWMPKLLTWRLSKEYRNSWLPTTCI